MRLINITKKTLLSTNLTYATTLKQQILGLLLYPTPSTLLLRTRFGIHTFGMNYAIDVLILDHTNRAVKIKENLTPNRIFFWNPLFSNVIELPHGSIKKSRTTVNDNVAIHN
jgi:uncharacterized membrane protein (UPF0127 family)